ncbi:MAG: type VI secretion system-associated protein TagF [Piscinibacter sp.]|nr:type VI secretion system-associated protein TagF [Piscinibacter sp.]
MEGDAGVPGWYGKLPTLGDFASRRLEGGFIDPWDRWLGEGLAAHRELLGEAWLDAYLGSPVWRFVLMPGVLDDEPAALAGVLMPSVDKVGRYFPLTLVRRLDELPHSAAQLESLLGWLQRLEDVAVDALHEDWTIDVLDDALAALPPPVTPPEPTLEARSLAEAIACGGAFVEIAALRRRSDLAALLWEAVADAPTAHPSAQGLSFWLADNAGSPRLLVSRGLPEAPQFIRMLAAAGSETVNGLPM